jgi:hypothetical protein
MNRQQLYDTVPEIRPLLLTADHVDIKTIDSEGVGLRPFIAGMLSYSPAWLKFLYGIRWVFVRLLGMTQPGMTQGGGLRPEEVSFTPGEWATFFQVTAAEDEAYWIAEATDKHLTAYLGVLVEGVNGRKLFHVFTIVHYHHWTGPVYFNVVRPFHHLVVSAMMRGSIKQQLPSPDTFSELPNGLQ